MLPSIIYMRAGALQGQIRVTSPNDWERVAREFFQSTCAEIVSACRAMGKFAGKQRARTQRITYYRLNEAGRWDLGT